MTGRVAQQHVDAVQERRAGMAHQNDLQTGVSSLGDVLHVAARPALAGAPGGVVLRLAAVLGMQRAVGNRVISRWLEAGARTLPPRTAALPSPATAVIHRCGATPCDCSVEERADEEAIQRIPTSSPTSVTAPPQQAGPSQGLGSTPAAALTPIPREVRQDHAARLAAGDQQGALLVIVRHMESVGEISPSLMATPVATAGGAAVCQTTVLWEVDPTMGRSALETPCGCTGPANDQRPNVRIRAGPGAVADIEHLHSALFHEFRHVRQDFEACRGGPSPGARFGGACTDCNKPEELDSYLAEAEAGYNPQAIRHAWARVVTNWTWLAPEQQQVFRARVTAVRGKVERLFPGVDWDNDAEVRRYSAFCSQMDQRAGGNTAGCCDSRMAPLSAPGPRPGLPLPPPPPPVGDFPLPPRGQAVA